MGIIELNNVTFSAQDRVIVKDISFKFETGRATAIIGPSGCGKSTILKLAAGLLVPDEGDILYKGENVYLMNRAANLEFRRESAFVFQDAALWANQNLDEMLELPLRIHYPNMDKKERERRIKDVVSEVGYNNEMAIRPSRLSMGEQKLIAFARALLCDPPLLYLDEWTESLDGSSVKRLIEIARARKQRGGTLIFVSHHMRIVSDLADTLVMINKGRIFMTIKKEEITGDEELRQYIEKGMAS
jgi:ABC-type multidrug transport system ATPase subunit